MEGGVCPECGFPVTRYRRKRRSAACFFLVMGRWYDASHARALTEEVE
jgi:hypothetical protein